MKPLTEKEKAIARRLLQPGVTHKTVARESGISISTFTRLNSRPEFKEYKRLAEVETVVAHAEAADEYRQLAKVGVATAYAESAIGKAAAELMGMKEELEKRVNPPLPDRKAMLSKLWEFACTKGNTDSQRAALNELWFKMGMDGMPPSDPSDDKHPDGLDVYKPAWMQ